MMTEDQVQRLRDWTNYEQEAEEERRIREIVAERNKTTSPQESSSNFLMTIDPRLLSRHRIHKLIDITPDSPSGPGQVLMPSRACRVAPGEDDFRAACQSPINVFSVMLPSTPTSPDLRRTIPLPAQSFSHLGPHTDRSIPIAHRTYFPYADSKVHFPIPHVDRITVIDTTTVGFLGPSESLTHASFSGRTQIFSLLAPRTPTFEQTLFPGHVFPNQCGPLDLPNVTALNLGERYVQLREARFSIISLYNRLREVLPRWLVEELDDPRFTLYVVRGEKLEKKYVN